MKMLGLDRRAIAVVSLALFCLSVTRSCFIQGERVKASQQEGQLSSKQNTDIQTCNDTNKELVFEGANHTFKFACPDKSNLFPVSASEGSTPTVSGDIDPTYRVYDFDPSKKTGCGSTVNLLGRVVPGSTIEAKSDPTVVNHRYVYTVALGPSQASPKYLCYTCKPSGNPSQRAANANTDTCTIYITVPGLDAQGNNPGSGASPPSNQDTASGSFSHSVFGCLVLGVAGPALGMMLHL